MARYRVLGGSYVEAITPPSMDDNGVMKPGQCRDYFAGDIVESDVDLSKKFQNKFELVKDDEPTETPQEKAIRLRRLADEAAKAVAEMDLDEPGIRQVSTPATQMSTSEPVGVVPAPAPAAARRKGRSES
jgi:hypothetical protein